MNINDFITANAAARYTGTQSSTQSAGSVNAATSAGLVKAEKRIQAQVDTTSAQLSSFGKLKSSVSGAQLAARSLGALSSTTTSAAEKTAATSFVTAFNSAITTAKTTAAVPGETAAALSANRASKDLLHTVSADSATLESLKKIGFNLGSDGTLALDAKKFDAAQKADATGVRATLVKIGQLVDNTASKELATNGNVGLSLSTLNQRSSILKSQQSTLSSLSQPTSATQSSINNSAFGFGVAAYQG
jgi:flagellar capping protein FliD